MRQYVNITIDQKHDSSLCASMRRIMRVRQIFYSFTVLNSQLIIENNLLMLLVDSKISIILFSVYASTTAPENPLLNLTPEVKRFFPILG